MSTNHFSELDQPLLALLAPLYGNEQAVEVCQRLLRLLQARQADIENAQRGRAHPQGRLSEQDVLLVTYGDSLVAPRAAPLAVLKNFVDANLTTSFSAVHILPFYPYSSDDGFAVSDYDAVREDLGTWGDVYALSEHVELMFDLVINHCSREHQWFAQFIGDQAPGRDYFIVGDTAQDLSAVVRPRSTPLLTQVNTVKGPLPVWTTFGEDQIDMNFANPDVLLEFVDILLNYLRRGATYIRLDAIGFLWKRVGSNCMSLPETHAVVKILRLLVTAVAPSTRLLTETNVPHAENLSYFGEGDEAQLVYQFSLAPLLLYSYLFRNPQSLRTWLSELVVPPDGSTYLNFIATHDGIGLRPLEGLVPPSDIDALVEITHQRGGFVSMRTGPDGESSPYELNITLFSLFGGTREAIPAFVGAHQLLLGLQGLPAIYVHSLFGTLNDMAAVEETGRTRSINRGRWERDALLEALADSDRHHRVVFGVLKAALRLRRKIAAFAPDAQQRVLLGEEQTLAVLRWVEDQVPNLSNARVLVVASFADVPLQCLWPDGWQHGLEDAAADERSVWVDLLTGAKYQPWNPLPLAPYQVVWLSPAASEA